MRLCNTAHLQRSFGASQKIKCAVPFSGKVIERMLAKCLNFLRTRRHRLLPALHQGTKMGSGLAQFENCLPQCDTQVQVLAKTECHAGPVLPVAARRAQDCRNTDPSV